MCMMWFCVIFHRGLQVHWCFVTHTSQSSLYWSLIAAWVCQKINKHQRFSVLKFNFPFVIYLLAVAVVFTLQPIGAITAEIESSEFLFIWTQSDWIYFTSLSTDMYFRTKSLKKVLHSGSIYILLSLLHLMIQYLSFFFFSATWWVWSFSLVCALPTTLSPEACVEGPTSEFMLKFWL